MSNRAEKQFVSFSARRFKTFRCGWPDFFAQNLRTKQFLGVEIKQGADKVTPEQKLMFAALEAAGFKVVIWNPSHPSTFTPWRAYKADRKRYKRTHSYPLNVMTTKEQLRTWRDKARASRMTLREWVTKTLDSAPLLRVDVKPVEATEGAENAR